MTPNKFFIITLGLSLIALPFCLFGGKWYDVQGFVSAFFELYCGFFALKYYNAQPPIKRSKFMHLVVAGALTFLFTNLVDGIIFSFVSLIYHGEKDHEIAGKIVSLWETYMLFYILFAGLLFFIIATALMVYVTIPDPENSSRK
jgi:hypothetical protein